MGKNAFSHSSTLGGAPLTKNSQIQTNKKRLRENLKLFVAWILIIVFICYLFGCFVSVKE